MKDKNDNKIKQYFLILYQGLKKDKFYWEFVNVLRKLLILAALLFPNSLKIMFGATVLIGTGRFQYNLKPYKIEDNNNVEMLAIVTGVFTVLSSLIYGEDEGVGFIENFVLFFTIILNIIFVLQWIRLFSQMYVKKNMLAKMVNISN